MARNTAVTADHHAPPITQALAHFVATHPSRGWSDAVDREAQRTLLNWLGCTVGAAQHESTAAALAAVQMLQPAPQAAVLGRHERVDMASAALVNGIASHTFDFDDTHLKTIIHPAGPVVSALLALAEHSGASGRELVDALVLGIDVSCRMGNVVYPEHYDRGWHITGSTGMLGAAAGCARLLRLDAQRTAMALGIAASQPVGLREQFGTMSKPLHPGAAARAGLMAALMAQHGFTASPRALEAPRGFAQVVSTKFDWQQATDELGQRFEISFNSYKPFACGIVIHPSIEACVQLRDQGVQPAQLERIDLKVHPLVLELTGNKARKDGLQAKFSVYHGCAAGLIFGRAGEAEFSDAVTTRADMVALRAKVVASVDEHIAEDAVEAVATLTDGRQIRVAIEHALGSIERPMSDAQLDTKFHELADPVLGAQQAQQLIAACRAIAAAPDVHALVALSRPQGSEARAMSARRGVVQALGAALFSATCLLGIAAPAIAQSIAQPTAQDYPSRPIRIVVPFSPGGAVDGPARVLAQELGKRLKQQVIIDNRPGAGATIGSEMVAKAAPDGHTLLLASQTNAISASLYARLPFNPIDDFVGISLLAQEPGVLVVHPSLPFKTVAELVAHAKARPGQLNYASSGNGSGQHLFMALFASMAGVQLTHVPYRGSGQATTDLLAGTVPMAMPGTAGMVAHIKAGKLRPLAVSGSARSPQLPDVPTLAESGLAGYSAYVWLGLMAPKGTPPALIERLNREVKAALATAEVKTYMAESGIEPLGSSPAELDAYFREERDRWARVIKETGAKID